MLSKSIYTTNHLTNRLPYLRRCTYKHFFNQLTMSTWNAVKLSKSAKNTFNTIRNVVEAIKIKPNPEKSLIALTLGDPTAHGCFKVPEFINQIITEHLENFSHNGYGLSSGDLKARESIASRATTQGNPITAEDVVITCGCSQAIEMAITALADPGSDVVLIPSPGFPLYKTICDNRGIKYRFYNLQPFNNWEIDIEHLKSCIDSDVKCIIFNNPGNPTGAVYSKEHLIELLQVAESFQIPIVSDEVYAYLAFSGSKYYSLGSLSEKVPIIELGGLAKRYSIPGWRIGWAVVHDRGDVFKYVREGLHNLTQITLGPPSIIQSIIAPLLLDTPESYFSETLELLEMQAKTIVAGLKGAHGLKAIAPQGGLYCMVHVDFNELQFDNTMQFTEKLLEEEAVFVLPGECFHYPNFIRIVITSPLSTLECATERIKSFCMRHIRKPSN